MWLPTMRCASNPDELRAAGHDSADFHWRLDPYGIYEAAQIGIPLTFLTFSRGFESQADFLGVQYMYRAGYDPQAFVTFEKLENLRRPRNPT